MGWLEEKVRLKIRKSDSQDGRNSREVQNAARFFSYSRLLITPNMIFCSRDPSLVISDQPQVQRKVIRGLVVVNDVSGLTRPRVDEASALCERPLGGSRSNTTASPALVVLRHRILGLCQSKKCVVFFKPEDAPWVELNALRW